MRQTAVLLAIIMLGLSAGGSVAQNAAKQPPFKATDYPIEVRKSLSLGPVTCREVEGGGKVEFAPDTVRKVDFNGDGRDDHVVSFENTKCSGFESAFCGTGGCMVDFLVTLPNGRIRSVFAGQVHSYEILPGHPRKVRFWIHHSNCADRSDGCSRDIRIKYGLFTPTR